MAKRTHDLSSMKALQRQSHKLQNAFEDSFWSKHCSFQMNFRIPRMFHVFWYSANVAPIGSVATANRSTFEMSFPGQHTLPPNCLARAGSIPITEVTQVFGHMGDTSWHLEAFPKCLGEKLSPPLARAGSRDFPSNNFQYHFAKRPSSGVSTESGEVHYPSSTRARQRL